MGYRACISGFKSIRHGCIDLDGVTVLLGPPASGKSNLLEALATLGYALRVAYESGEWGGVDAIGPLTRYVRARVCNDLLPHPLLGSTGPSKAVITLEHDSGRVSLSIECEKLWEARLGLEVKANGVTVDKLVIIADLTLQPPSPPHPIPTAIEPVEKSLSYLMVLGLLKAIASELVKSSPPARVTRASSKRGLSAGIPVLRVPSIRFYSFDRMVPAYMIASGYLSERRPSYLREDGANAGWILYADRKLAHYVNSLLREITGVEVRVDNEGRVLFYDKDIGMPPLLASDTIVRLLYITLAVKTAKTISLSQVEEGVSVQLSPLLLIEEPESHIYPLVHEVLVDLLRSGSRKTPIILTTHSVSIAQLLVEKVDANIYYLRRVEEGSVVCTVDKEKMINEYYGVDDIIRLEKKMIEEGIVKCGTRHWR